MPSYSMYTNKIKNCNSYKTIYTSPSRASYGVSIVRICGKNDLVITAPHSCVNIPSTWSIYHLRKVSDLPTGPLCDKILTLDPISLTSFPSFMMENLLVKWGPKSKRIIIIQILGIFHILNQSLIKSSLRNSGNPGQKAYKSTCFKH